MYNNKWNCTTLSATFCSEISRLDGPNSLFLRAVNADDTRYVLDDLADYDALRDGFLLLPALENILATVPGQEDLEGLTALLDPSTLTGRVGRINLITRGSNSMLLAMPRSPTTSPDPSLDNSVSGRQQIFVPSPESMMV